MLQLKAMSLLAARITVNQAHRVTGIYICYVSDFMGSTDLHKRKKLLKHLKILATIANGLKCFWLTRVTTAFLQDSYNKDKLKAIDQYRMQKPSE